MDVTEAGMVPWSLLDIQVDCIPEQLTTALNTTHWSVLDIRYRDTGKLYMLLTDHDTQTIISGSMLDIQTYRYTQGCPTVALSYQRATLRLQNV